jgi:hypothetical protein
LFSSAFGPPQDVRSIAGGKILRIEEVREDVGAFHDIQR